MTKQNNEQSNVVDIQTAKKGQKCPLCQKKTDEKFKPFCSKRCADLDLGKWLGEGYRIPSEELLGSNADFDEEV